MTKNCANENGVEPSSTCSFFHVNSSDNPSSQITAWELGLRGGEHLAKYYLELVRMHLYPQNKSIDTSYSVADIKKRQECDEIEKHIKDYQKQR